MLLMVTPGTQIMSEEIRNAADKAKESLVAQGLLEEPLRALNEFSVKAMRSDGTNECQ